MNRHAAGVHWKVFGEAVMGSGGGCRTAVLGGGDVKGDFVGPFVLFGY